MSCDKVEQSKKKLDGIWTIVSYEYTDSQGFNYYPEVNGKLFFENCEGNPCAYTIDIRFTHSVATGERVEQGTYTLDEKGEIMDLVQILPGGQTINKPNNKILLLTRNDLKIQYSESGATHEYIFEK